MNREIYLTPCFPAFFTLLTVVLTVFFFPPSIYSYFMREPDFIYGNIKTFFFVSSCLFAFCMGFKLGNFKSIIRFNIYFFLIDPSAYFNIVLFIGYALLAIYLILFNYFVYLKFNLNFFDILLIYGYQYLKYQPSFIPFGLGAIPTFLGFYSFYILFTLYQLQYKYSIKNKKNTFVAYLFITLVFLVNLLTVNRNILVIMFFGLIVIYIYFHSTYLFSKFTVLGFIKFSFIAIIIFIATLIFRFGTLGDLRVIGEQLLGYTFSGYNRLALIISYDANLKDINPSVIDLVLPNRIPLFNIYIKQPLPISESINYWHSLLKEYNLNYWFNLRTFFGVVYNRIGIFSFVFFLIYGILGGRLYRYFKEEKIIGILFYPTFFASVFVWPLTNIFITNLFYNIYAFFFIFIIHLIMAPNFKKYEDHNKQ